MACHHYHVFTSPILGQQVQVWNELLNHWELNIMFVIHYKVKVLSTSLEFTILTIVWITCIEVDMLNDSVKNLLTLIWCYNDLKVWNNSTNKLIGIRSNLEYLHITYTLFFEVNVIITLITLLQRLASIDDDEVLVEITCSFQMLQLFIVHLFKLMN